MVYGFRGGELAGLKASDIDFVNLIVNVVRSVVDQVTGTCKAEASREPQPIDEYTEENLLAWYRVTPNRARGGGMFLR
jgi:integrase